MTANERLRLLLAAAIALLGGAALCVDFAISMTNAIASGRGLPAALFLYFRYFTILTTLGITLLMLLTVACVLRRRRLPHAAFYNGGLVYALVMMVTYEVLLRSQWTPRGLQKLTDTTFHDAVPSLTLVFWLVCAPRGDTRWTDALWMLCFPALYFAVTLLGGVLGAGYPYDFLDVARLGYPVVLLVALLFLAIFFALGLAVTAAARRRSAPSAQA